MTRNFDCFDEDLYDPIHRRIREIDSAVAKVECHALYHLARTLDVPGCIVEIGSYLGRSTCAIGYGAADSKRIVYAIDHHKGDELSGVTVGQEQGLHFNLGRFGLLGHVVMIVKDSLAAAVEWPSDKPIAMLFIDGLHTETQCKADFLAFAPYLSPRAWVCFHDYGLYGVKPAVDRFVSDGHIKQPHVVRSLAVTRVVQ